MTIAIVSTGAFGRQVAGFINDYANAQPIIHEETLDGAFDLDNDLVVAATWRPSPSLCDRADELSFERRRPWLPVVMEHWRITVGPLIRPPGGPCYECFVRRKAQHDTRHSETVAADRALSQAEGAGPRGCMPYHARITASLAIRLAQLTQACSPSSAPKVIGYDLVASDISVSSVMRCHDCRRCADRTPPAQRAAAVKVLLGSRR